MPSPGRTAILMAGLAALPQPRLLGEMPRLELADRVRVLKRESDVVETVDEAVLAERIDVEAERHRPVGRSHPLALEVDGELEAGKRLHRIEEPADFELGQHDRQQAVLEAVVEEDVGVRRRDQRAKSVVEKR